MSVLEAARSYGFTRLALAGVSDVAEIAIICALERDMEIVAVIDPHSTLSDFVRLPVVESFELLVGTCDGVIVTDIKSPRETYVAAVSKFGKERVFVLSILGMRTTDSRVVST
jgi:hypothetical protein